MEMAPARVEPATPYYHKALALTARQTGLRVRGALF